PILIADLIFCDCPVLYFIMFWLLHIIVFVAPLLFVFPLGYRPTWRGYGLTLAITVGWAAVTFTVNSLVGTNYGYLNGAPAGPSILDVLGPWPTYLLWEAVLVAAVWALMTWPWVRAARRKNHRAPRLGTALGPPVVAESNDESEAGPQRH